MKKLLFILMLLPALAYAQFPVHSYPIRDTVDDSSQFLGIEIIPGGWHTYRFPFTAFLAAVADSINVKPSGGLGSIQLSGGDTLTNGSNFKWLVNKFVFGLGDGNNYIVADTNSKSVSIGIDAGSDTLKGNVYLKKLAGNGVGSVGIDNTGKLKFNSATTSKIDTSATTLNNVNADVIALQINPIPTTTVYEIGGYVNITAVSGGGFAQFAVVYFDENGISQVSSIFSAVTDVAGSGLSHMAAVGHFPIPSISLVIQAGSNFAIEGLHTGSVTYNIGCSVKQH